MTAGVPQQQPAAAPSDFSQIWLAWFQVLGPHLMRLRGPNDANGTLEGLCTAGWPLGAVLCNTTRDTQSKLNQG